MESMEVKMQRRKDFFLLGKPDMFKDPEALIDRFYEYIEYIEQHPLKSYKMYGEGQLCEIPQMIAPSMEGLVRYLRTHSGVLDRYKSYGPQWKEAFKLIEEHIYSIVFEGASAGLIKESIIIRKLGLAEKIEKKTEERKIVIMYTPDNERAVRIEDQSRRFELPQADDIG